MLLDDMFTKGSDVGLAALCAHPNFEIRIFNPFNRGLLGRSLGSLTDFTRINRRMHNKSFTVDGRVTIVGGRNIAAEYFGAREDAEFADLDVLAIGPAVNDVSAMFDAYWNHETAVPVPAFVDDPEDPDEALSAVREVFNSSDQELKSSAYATAVHTQIYDYLSNDPDFYHWASYDLIYDSPDKGIRQSIEGAEKIITPLMRSLRASQDQVIIVSPYFVPRRSGVEFLARLEEQGVHVTIITNSLAANNQFTVHAGYSPSRKPLLAAGVEIFEVRPDVDVSGAQFIAAGGAMSTLHTKAFVIDSTEVFIGSFNFDPRSANINTEMGVIIKNPRLATVASAWVADALRLGTFRVYLNEDGDLRWSGVNQSGHVTVYDKEPMTNWRKRFLTSLMRLVPIRGQL